MTGFAREAGVSGPSQWAFELRSVNGRGLDVRTRVPPGFDWLGEEVRQAVSASLSRGQCNLSLAITRSPGAARTRINAALLDDLLAAVSRLRVPDGVGPATLDGLLAIRGVVETDDEAGRESPDEALRAELSAAVRRLVPALAAARAREGEALAGVIEGQLRTIGALVAEAERHLGRRPDAVKARLAAQVAALVDGPAALDPARLHQEAVLLASRADIREELDRLDAHVAAATELVRDASPAPIGRRLDFLAQEFGREANTLCAKANDVALSRIGLELKVVVEQLREQVQNVE